MKRPDPDTIVDAVCAAIAIAFIACFAAGFYTCPGCEREKFVAAQAAYLDAEGGAQ